MNEKEKENDIEGLRPKFAWLIGEIGARGYLKSEYSGTFLKYLKLYSGNVMDTEIDEFFNNYIFARELAHPWAMNSLFASLTRLILDDKNYYQAEKWQSQLKAEFDYIKSGIEAEKKMLKNSR